MIPALLALIERLARRHELHVFALAQEKTPSEYPLLGARVHNLGLAARSLWPGQALLPVFRALLSGLRAHGPFDLAHAFWANNPGFLTACAARRLRIPFVLSLGGGELVAFPAIGYGSQLLLRERLKVRVSLRSAARVTVASGPMADLARRHGIEPAVVPLGVGAALFPESEASGSERDMEPPRLLHVASLNRVKDQATLLRAFRRVAAERPDVRLDIVGEDTLGGEIQDTCASLGLAPRVTFHGFLPADAVLPFFLGARLLVVSSLHEAGPLVTLEAAACGVPTVGTAVGHVRDFGESAPECALAVPVGDDGALAAGILALLADGPRRHAMGDAARNWARAHDADATAAAFERIYTDATEGLAAP